MSNPTGELLEAAHEMQFRVDTVAPKVAIKKKKTSFKGASKATILFRSSDRATGIVARDCMIEAVNSSGGSITPLSNDGTAAAQFVPCAAKAKHAFTNMVTGQAYKATVRVTDGAGNTATSSYTFTYRKLRQRK